MMVMGAADMARQAAIGARSDRILSESGCHQTPPHERQTNSKTWMCLICGFDIYDEASGIPAREFRLEPRWEDVR